MRKVTEAAVRKLLTDELRLKSPEFHLATGRAGLVNGHVVSPTFRGKRDRQRLGMIWDALEFALGREEAKRSVGMLIAYTPEEWRADEVVAAAPKAKRRKAG